MRPELSVTTGVTWPTRPRSWACRAVPHHWMGRNVCDPARAGAEAQEGDRKKWPRRPRSPPSYPGVSPDLYYGTKGAVSVAGNKQQLSKKKKKTGKKSHRNIKMCFEKVL